MAIPIRATLKVSSKAFTGGIKVAGKAVGGLAAVAKLATFAIIGLSAAFTALVARQAALIDRIGKVAKTTGIAAETLQKFSFAAELAGVSTDQAQVALRRFSRRLGEAQKGTGELAPTLKRLGIDLRDSSGEFKSAEEVLFDLADAIANTEGSSERLSIAFKAFDSEGAELVSVLANGSDAMKALFNEAESLGAVLSGSAIRGVEAFNDEFNKLQTLISGIANTFVAALAPALTRVTEDLVDFLKATAETNGGFENFGKFLKDEFISIVQEIVKVFAMLGNILIDLSNKIVRFGRKMGQSGLPELTEDGKKAKEQVDILKKVLEDAPNINIFTGFGPERIGQFTKFVKELDTSVPILKEVQNAYLRLMAEMAGATPKTQETMKTFFEGLFDDLIQGDLVLFGGIKELEEQMNSIEPFNVEDLLEYLEGLKGVTSEVEKTNDEVEEQLTFFEKIAALLEKMPARMQEFIDKTIDFGEIFANVAARLGTPLERLQKTLEDGLVKGVEVFEQTLTDAILTGKADFSALGDHIKKVLAQALVQRFITGPILAAFGLASGGPAKAGQPYIVGEEGPELFIPRNSGTVIPNDETMGIMGAGGAGVGGTNVTYNIQAVDAPSFQQLVARDPEFIFNVSRAGSRRTP